MSHEIETLLSQAAAVTDVALDTGAIRRGGERMRIRRRASIAFLAATTLVLAVLALPRLDLSPSESRQLGPAVPGEQQLPQYNLDPVGPQQLLTKGEQLGTPWELVGTDTKSGRYCVEFRLGKQEAFGGVTVCDPFIPQFEDLSAIRGYFQGRRNIAPVIGAVSREVATVEIHLSDGPVITADIVDAPEGSSANFYVAFIEPGMAGTAVASDAAGVLEKDPVDVCRGPHGPRPSVGTRTVVSATTIVASCGIRTPDRFEP
jgi:hypothetical protein